jgi:mannose-1-phosphate guanylyltransferase
MVLSLGHLAEEILGYIESRPYPNMEMVPVVESTPLGTLGGIAHSRSQIHSDPALVVNGDTYIDADLGAFLEFHRSKKFSASLVCTKVDDEARYGRVEIDQDGAILAFREKQPESRVAGYISGGVYLLNASAFDRIDSIGSGSIEHDFFAVQSPSTLGGFAGDFEFIDFGTPESLKDAQKFFATRVNRADQ